MIKFFRKIRQNLLMENKTGKYFKYAIGEIVLVVIGILIAFSLNNWNDNRKNQKKEKLFIDGLINDLNKQKLLLDAQISYEENKVDEVNRCFQIIEEYSIKNSADSIFDLMNRLNPRKTFVVIDPTFEELKSTGSLSLISNQDLRKDIISFYQNLELQSQVITNNNFNIDNLYKPFTSNNRLGFYYNSEGKLVSELDKDPSTEILLKNMLEMRKNLSGSNLSRARNSVQELEKLSTVLKKNFHEH